MLLFDVVCFVVIFETDESDGKPAYVRMDDYAEKYWFPPPLPAATGEASAGKVGIDVRYAFSIHVAACTCMLDYIMNLYGVV